MTAAAGEFARLVTEGGKSGDITGYAADDLRLELRNMLANDDAGAVPNLRRKLDDRLREQALTRASKRGWKRPSTGCRRPSPRRGPDPGGHPRNAEAGPLCGTGAGRRSL